MVFTPSAPLGSISPVAIDVFDELKSLTDAELLKNIKLIEAEIEAFELELQKAVDQQVLEAWDEARQWLAGFKKILSNPVYQIRELEAELKRTDSELEAIAESCKSARSHDELMMVDVQEVAIINRQTEIEKELEKLRANL